MAVFQKIIEHDDCERAVKHNGLWFIQARPDIRSKWIFMTVAMQWFGVA